MLADVENTADEDVREVLMRDRVKFGVVFPLSMTSLLVLMLLVQVPYFLRMGLAYTRILVRADAEGVHCRIKLVLVSLAIFILVVNSLSYEYQ